MLYNLGENGIRSFCQFRLRVSLRVEFVTFDGSVSHSKLLMTPFQVLSSV